MSRTTIHIETHEVKTIRFRTRSATAHCTTCICHVPIVTPEQAAELLNISLTSFYGLVDANAAHMIDTRSLVCGRSLDGFSTNTDFSNGG